MVVDNLHEDFSKHMHNENSMHLSTGTNSPMSFTLSNQAVPRELIEDEKIRNEIPRGAEIHVEQGASFDFSQIKIEEQIPHTRNFRIFKYKNPRTQRLVKLLKCDHDNCKMFFRKWHNFFDHLRVHTGERPFVCPISGCEQSFTQKANLNKHITIHQKKRKQQCPHCHKFFSADYIFKVPFFNC